MGPPTPEAAARRSTRAFGLRLDAGFAVAGLEPEAGAGADGPTVTVELAAAEEVERRAAVAPLERISDRPWMTIDGAPDSGFLIRAEGLGEHWIGPGGRELLCAPPEPEPPAWQRLLTGQLLPFAALLHGFEVLHASAVVLDGRAIAIVGGSGAGKSTIARRLVRDGAGFLTDDVVALEPRGDHVLAHPGTGLSSIRRADRESELLMVERHGRPEPLGLVCFLRRDPEADRLELAHPGALEPRLLLGATFNFVVRTPERLARQLDIAARVARSARVVQATVPPATSADELAAAVAEAAR